MRCILPSPSLYSAKKQEARGLSACRLITRKPTFQFVSVLQLREGPGVCASLLQAWDRTGGPCGGQVRQGCLENPSQRWRTKGNQRWKGLGHKGPWMRSRSREGESFSESGSGQGCEETPELFKWAAREPLFCLV